jgi:L-ascorbate 6-phosphate lactonase
VTPVLTWLGRAGFLVEAGGARLLVDPFFAAHEDRTFPPPPIDVHGARIDRVLVSHEHLDHLDPESLRGVAQRSPVVEAIAPLPPRDAIEAMPCHGVRPEDRLDLPGGAALRVVPAVHALHPRDGYPDGGDPPRFVGYVLEIDGVAIDHAGDTIADDRVLAGLHGVRVDVALLPVNGRTFFRERDDLAGNLDARDAVALAAHCSASAALGAAGITPPRPLSAEEIVGPAVRVLRPARPPADPARQRLRPTRETAVDLPPNPTLQRADFAASGPPSPRQRPPGRLASDRLPEELYAPSRMPSTPSEPQGPP